MKTSPLPGRLVIWALAFSLGLLADLTPAGEPEDLPVLEAGLRAAETTFAQTMADRDLAAFSSHLAEETVFFGRDTILRGRPAVVAAWARHFEHAAAPFSWKPEVVAVLNSGELGMTSGPVYDPGGRRIGTFNSVWRRTNVGVWEIVFDRGCPPCSNP